MPSLGGPRDCGGQNWSRCCKADGLVVDLRSGTYAASHGCPAAVVVRVVSGGRRRTTAATVSHFNKAYKGLLAAVLATTRAEPSTVDQLVKVITKAGLTVERTGDHSLELLTG